MKISVLQLAKIHHRRIITLLALCAVISVASTAQTVIKRQRPDYTPPKEHLSFDGIAINGHLNDFVSNLKRKGYKKLVKDNAEGEDYQDMTGNYAGINGWEIYIDSDDDFKDSIYCVRLFNECATGGSQLSKYNTVKDFIESKYPISGKIVFNSEQSYGGESETLYNIENKGTITVTYGNEDGVLFVGMRFKDKDNDNLYGNHPTAKTYILENIKSAFQKCRIEASELEIKFDIQCPDKIYTFVSRKDDKQQILQLLDGNYDNQMKVYILNNYILTGLERCKQEKAIPVVETECEKIFRQYIAAAEKAKQNQTTPMRPKDMLLEALRQMIFSPKERQTLDKVVPPEVQRQMIGGTIGVMGASSGYHTSYEKYINPYVHD